MSGFSKIGSIYASVLSNFCNSLIMKVTVICNLSITNENMRSCMYIALSWNLKMELS